MKTKPKILFCYYLEDNSYWEDGLNAALKILEADYDIDYWNFFIRVPTVSDTEKFDAVLFWTSFETTMDRYARQVTKPKALLIGGYAFEPSRITQYNALFYETEWYTDQIAHHKNKFHAFGINTDVYHPLHLSQIFDYLSPGSYAAWKRQLYLAEKKGIRMTVGKIQDGDSAQESIKIMGQLLIRGVGVMGEVTPKEMNRLINSSACIYLPADIMGGGERSLLEARACGVPVEIRDDNDKLKELLTCPVWDQHYYASQLRKGIESIL